MREKNTALTNDEIFLALRKTKNLSPSRNFGGIIVSISLEKLLHEAGALFLQGNKLAEINMALIFKRKRLKAKELVYSYFSQRRITLNPESLLLIEDFEKNPKNAEKISTIKNHLIRDRS